MIKPYRKAEIKKAPFKLNLVQKLVLLLGLIVLAFVALPIVIIMIIGLLPTLTILLLNSKDINRLMIVGCFNMAGVFICMVNLLGQYTSGIQITILNNVFNIIIMLGAAALGMIVFFELPNLFVSISRASAQRRLHNIDAKLEKLSADWGNEIIEQISK